jgi:hypothetical protein
MKWMKKGLIFTAHHQHDWMASHTQIPVADKVSDDILRIYISTRDDQNRSHPGYIEVLTADPQKVVRISENPVFALGKSGTFDDNGIMPSWIVDRPDGVKYLYYIGWSPRVTVSYHLSIGLAVSKDGGDTFERYSEGPICDRGVDEPYFNTTPCVLLEDDAWKMWYASCTGWEIIDNRPEPFYNVKYARSSDGVHWEKTGRVCIDYDHFTNAIACPCVMREDGIYKMFYSYRSAAGYRTAPQNSYRLGYAESPDGILWTRKDDEVGIDKSALGWDSEMICYSYVYTYQGRKYMLYCGNGFGKSGMGYAVLEEP